MQANTTQAFDCAVIGGGLAGLTLAIQLQRQGMQTVLFEKEAYPFHKVCGEYISMESWDFLERLGVPLSQLQLPMIRKLQLSAPGGRMIEAALKPGGFGISRYTLDALLVQLAREAGVQVMEQTRVNDVHHEDKQYTIITGKGGFTAPLVFGSWGKRGNLDVKLGRSFIQPQHRRLNHYIAVKYHVQADLPADTIGLHNFHNGYCGISKVDAERYCLCYLTTASNLHAAGNDVRKMEEMYLHRNPHLQQYFRRFQSLYEAPLAISQISFEAKTRNENGMIMLGDTAGLITPLCGNGMSMAMHASALLAGLVSQTRDPQQLAAQYERAWQKQFATRLRAGRMIQSLFGHEVLTNITVAALKPFPYAVKGLIGLTHGNAF